MPSSFASTVFTRKNKSRVIAACVLAAGFFFLLAVGFACFGGPAAHEPAASLVTTAPSGSASPPSRSRSGATLPTCAASTRGPGGALRRSP